MNSERALWNYIRGGLKSDWYLQRHEDRISAGVPDVSYSGWGTGGWLELKVLKRWPARKMTPVKIGLTKEQALWLRQCGKHGNGNCFILLRVGRGDFLLFNWQQALALTEPRLQTDIRQRALRTWKKRVDFNELKKELTQRGGKHETRTVQEDASVQHSDKT
jgi:hypothetical protein